MHIRKNSLNSLIKLLLVLNTTFALCAAASGKIDQTECPSLGGRYECPQFGTTLTIEQEGFEGKILYKVLNTGEVIRTDGNLHPYLTIPNTHYRASCRNGELNYDIYGHAGKDKLSAITHEHQIWALKENRFTIDSVIVRTLANFGIEEMPIVSCYRK